MGYFVNLSPILFSSQKNRNNWSNYQLYIKKVLDKKLFSENFYLKI